MHAHRIRDPRWFHRVLLKYLNEGDGVFEPPALLLGLIELRGDISMISVF
jgi:hypothetical protein